MRLVITVILTLLAIAIGAVFGFALLLSGIDGHPPVSDFIFVFIFLGIFALFVGIIVAYLIRGMFKAKGREVGSFFIVKIALFYMVAGTLSPLIVAFGISMVANIIGNIRRGVELKEQSYDSVKIGTIRKDNSELAYECIECSYRIKFPNTWAFREGAHSNFSNLYLITPDIKKSGNTVMAGAEFNISKQHDYGSRKDEYWNEEHMYLLNDPSVGKISAGNITALVEKSVSKYEPDYRHAVVWIYTDSHIFQIRAVYGNDYEFDGYLKILLNNFEQL